MKIKHSENSQKLCFGFLTKVKSFKRKVMVSKSWKKQYPTLLATQAVSPFLTKASINHSFWLSKAPKTKTCKKNKLICFSMVNEKQTYQKLLTANSKSWKKSLTTFYYLLDAYKQTLRFYCTQSFYSSTNWSLLLAVSPFLGYFLQKEMSGLESYSERFFLKTLPGINQPTPKLTWETFAYTNYSQKMSTFLKAQITDLGDGFLISLNPNWELKQKQFFTATFPSSTLHTDDDQCWSFLPSRYYYQFLSEEDRHKLQLTNAGFKHYQVFPSSKSFSKQLHNRWQVFFNSLDDIPIKVNGVFKDLTPSLNPKLDVLLFSNPSGKPVGFKSSTTNLQKPLTLNEKNLVNAKKTALSSNVQLGFRTFKNDQTKTLLTTSKNHVQIKSLVGFFQNYRSNLQKVKVPCNVETSAFPSLDYNDCLPEFSDTNSLNTPLPSLADTAFMKFLDSANLVSENQGLNLPDKKPEDFEKDSKQMMINMLDDKLTKAMQKDVLAMKRKFYYQITNNFRLLQLKTLNNQSQLKQFQIEHQKLLQKNHHPAFKNIFNGKTFYHFDKQFQSQLNLLSLGLEAKLDPRAQPKQDNNEKVENLGGQKFLEGSQRKVSGYLYPDNIKTTLFRKTKAETISLHDLFQKNKKNSFLEYYNLGFSTLGLAPISKENLQKKLNYDFRSCLKNLSTAFFISKPFPRSFVELPAGMLINDSKSSYATKPSFLTKTNQSLFKPASILNFSSSPADFVMADGTFSSIDFLRSFDADQSWTSQKICFLGEPAEIPLYGLTFDDVKKEIAKNGKFVPVKSMFSSPYGKAWKLLYSWTARLNDEKEEAVEMSPSAKLTATKALNFYADINSFSEKLQEPLYEENYLPDFEKLSKAPSFSKMVFSSDDNVSSFQPPMRAPLNWKPDQLKDSIIPTAQTFPPFASNASKATVFVKRTQLTNNSHSVTYKKQDRFFQKSKLTALDAFPLNFLKNSKVNQVAVENVLYEPLQWKSWTVLSQLGLIFVFWKLLEVFKNEYTVEILYYLADFYAFLNKSDKEMLNLLTPDEEIRVIYQSNKKFKDLVGGQSLLAEFGETLLLARNSKKYFQKMAIAQPQPLMPNIFYGFFDKWLLSKKILNPSSGLYLDSALRYDCSSFWNVLLSNKDVSKTSFQEKMKKLTAKRLLLVGPPGTGKTLFVKAFAGEAEIPIIVESGKTLTSTLEMDGAERLKDLFKAAREKSPCILFFDEIDTLGPKREKVVTTSLVAEIPSQIPNTLKKIYLQTPKETSFHSRTLISQNAQSLNWGILNPAFQTLPTSAEKHSQSQDPNMLNIQFTNQRRLSGEKQNRDLVMLTQLLVELDGLTNSQELIVIGATNRPATLDSALTRPGRFGKVIYLDLPGKQKRFSLLKFYSKSSTYSLQYVENPISKFKIPSILLHIKKGSFKVPTLFKPVATVLETLEKKLEFFNYQQSKVPLGLKASPITAFSTSFNKKTFFGLRPWPFLKNFKAFKKDMPVALRLSSFFFQKKFFTFPLFFTTSEKLDNTKSWQALKLAPNVDLNYFSNQTVGLSSAHLAAAMNRSAFKAIFLYLSKQKRKNPLKNTFFAKEKKSVDMLLSELNIEQLKAKKSSATGLKSKALFLVLANLGKSSHYFGSSCQKTENGLNPIIKNHSQVFHTFESISYGVQSLSTSLTSPSFKLSKGKKVTLAFLGLYSIYDFEQRSSRHSCFATKVALEKNDVFSDGKSTKRRSRFYKKHRRYFRSLALLEKNVNLIQFSKQPKNTQKTTRSFEKKPPIFVAVTDIVKRYVSRHFINAFWGWELLMNSSCFLQNPLVFGSVQKQNQKLLSNITYQLLSLNQRQSQDWTLTFLNWQKFNEKIQKKSFGDSFFLNRSATYLSGKVFLNFYTALENQNTQKSLWSFYASPQSQYSTVEKSTITKLDYEKYLTSLIAGKATEILNVTNPFGLTLNHSNLGFDDLKKLTQVIKFMTEDCLSEKQLSRKQGTLELVENSKQLAPKEKLAFFKKLAFFESQKPVSPAFTSSSLTSSELFQSLEQPWWQLKASQSLAFANFKDGQWYRLFLWSEQSNFRNIEMVSPDDYFHNQSNHDFSLFTDFSKKGLITENLPKRPNSLFSFQQSSNFNMNQLLLIDFDSKLLFYLFEAFNKVFDLLENNRELIDLLSTTLLCNENLRPFEIALLHRRFFKQPS